MKKKIQRLHNIDCFNGEFEAIYYIKSEKYEARIDDVTEYL